MSNPPGHHGSRSDPAAVAAPARHYHLRCPVCAAEFEDDGRMLRCPEAHEPGLLQAEYAERSFRPDPDVDGIYRFHEWLPAGRTIPKAAPTVVYHSKALNRMAGLSNLWVAFNGYWPERGATLETTTFKELEAWAVLGRLPEATDEVMVIASAGNTAAAFARACSLSRVRCLIVVPEVGLASLEFSEPLDPCVKIVSLVGFTDYADAITLANRIAALDGFFPEGGVANVARRAGLGTTMLTAVDTIGRLPDFYFQAVGSGAGGIGVHEAARLLLQDGRFGNRFPRLMLSQNLPFVPLYSSWTAGRRELVAIDPDDGRRQIRQIAAHVLSNRQPPYSIRGGVYDVLVESGGDMLAADNLETLPRLQLFEEMEGIDIDPASAVALATLLKAARSGLLDHDALVLLNITGGGRYRRHRDRRLIPVRPALQLDQQEIYLDPTLDKIVNLFR
jgi:cysteate synthase